MVKFTYARFFIFKGEYFLHMGFAHYLFVRHQLLEAVPSLCIFLVSLLRFHISLPQFAAKYSQTLGWLSQPRCGRYDVSQVTQSNSTFTKRRKSVVCLYTDQLRPRESWTGRDLRDNVILLSHLQMTKLRPYILYVLICIFIVSTGSQ